MTHREKAPDTGAIYALYTPVFVPQVARVALLLDLFTPLEDGPLDAEALARAKDCSVEGIRMILDCLAAAGLLVISEGQYGLTPTAETFLVRGSPAYAGDWVLAETDPRFWEGVLTSVRTGERVSIKIFKR